jgi:hypothetical protein
MPGVSRQAKPQRPAYAASHIRGHPGGVQAGPRPEHPRGLRRRPPAQDAWSAAPAVIGPFWGMIADAAIVAGAADNSQQIADSRTRPPQDLEDVLSQLQRDTRPNPSPPCALDRGLPGGTWSTNTLVTLTSLSRFGSENQKLYHRRGLVQVSQARIVSARTAVYCYFVRS